MPVIYVQHDEAVRLMTKGLIRFMDDDTAHSSLKSLRASRSMACTATA